MFLILKLENVSKMGAFYNWRRILTCFWNPVLTMFDAPREMFYFEKSFDFSKIQVAFVAFLRGEQKINYFFNKPE